MRREPSAFHFTRLADFLPSPSARNESLNSTLVTGLIREAAQRDIKRAEGAAGQLGRISAADDFCPAYVRAEGPPTAFPSSMDVIFTGKKNIVYGEK